MKHLEIVLNSRLFDGIDKKDMMMAFDSLDITSRRFRKAELLFCENEVIDCLCIPKDGRIKAERLYPTGHIHIIEIIEPGALFGFEIASSRLKQTYCDYVAENDCEVVFISFDSIIESPYVEHFQRALNSMLADECIKKINKSFILAEYKLRERLLAYFDILQKKSGTNKITVKMNREQLSDYLCVNRSALSNELSKMKREGLIEINKTEYTLLYINK